MNAILSWWDGVELWLSGLGFVFQTIVVMPVVLALAYVIAAALDGALGRGIGLLSRLRHRRRRARMSGNTGMPRSRVTLILVALVVLVIVAWLLTR